MKKIGLALGSGGARGYAHIGVLKALEEKNIKIDYISGSSIGAIIGALYASGLSAAEIEKYAKSFDFIELFKLFDLGTKGALLKGNKLKKYLDNLLPVKNFEELKIPLHVVATNVKTGDEYVFSEGPIIDALRASAAIPLVFKVHKNKNGEFADGGLSNPVPVSVLKEKYDPFVIAVDLDATIVKNKNKRKIKLETQVLKTLDILRYNLAKLSVKDADVVIKPEVGGYYWFELTQADKIIQAGHDAAKDVNFGDLEQ